MTAKLSFLKGTQASAESFNTSHSVLGQAGMSVPATFSVSNNELMVGPHSGMFGTGATLSEQEAQVINTQKYFSIGATAFKGTLLYRLDPSLYFSPVLSIEAGHLSVGSDPNTLIVGWVNYPGGTNNNISVDMFYPASTASRFEYTKFWNAREILESLPVVINNPNSLAVTSPWWAAMHPTQYTVWFGADNGNASSVRVSVEDIDSEYWVVLENTGVTEFTVNFSGIFYNNYESSTSAHVRLEAETGVVISTGIMYRGSPERTLGTGTIAGPVDAGMVSISLIEAPTPIKEAFRLNFHMRIPGGKKLKLASIGTGNASFFEQTYVAD